MHSIQSFTVVIMHYVAMLRPMAMNSAAVLMTSPHYAASLQAHSKKTVDSGIFRGPPTADWYHFQGWPLRVGQGILQGVAEAAAGMKNPTAVEGSFMSPGLGPAGHFDMGCVIFSCSYSSCSRLLLFLS
jgi:hypothetical protein